MLAKDIQEQLASMHPESTLKITHLNQLARDTTDADLLNLCSSYIDTILRNLPWQPPHSLTEREQAYLTFAEQFTMAVSAIEDRQVAALMKFSSADEIYCFVNALYVVDMTLRLNLVVGRVLI
jgi:hypothetical protein